MELWRQGLVVRRLAEGATFHQAAKAAGVNRVTIWRRMQADRGFAEQVEQARLAGEPERIFRLWLRHPFRGRRPPTGKGHGGKPRFRYGRGGG